MTGLRHIILSASLAIALASPALATAQTPGEATTGTTTGTTATPITRAERKRVGMLLGAFHGLPARKDFAKASPRAEQIVRDFASRTNDIGPYRRRALEALGTHWADARTFTLFTTILTSTTEPGPVRRQVMLLTARAYNDRALPLLTPALRATSPLERTVAVEAVRLITTAAATTALRDALKIERDPVVRKKLEQATRVVQ